MINVPFNVGAYITNGTSAGRVTELVERDPRWKTDGVRVSNIGLELFGGNVGQTSFVPGYLLGSWAEIPFEWAPVKGSDDLVERYVWRDKWRRLEREVQRTGEGEGPADIAITTEREQGSEFPATTEES